MEFPIAGEAYKHPSIDVNNQRCVNMFLTSAGPQGRGGQVLLPTSGLSLLTSVSSSGVRGLWTFGDYVYVVAGNTAYQLTINYLTETVTNIVTLGTFTTSVGTVYAAMNPTQIIFVDGSTTGYIYTPGSGTWAAIADTDFLGANQVVFIDGYFFVNKPNTGQFYCSALNDGTSWDALDIATAESATDNLIGLNVAKNELWLFGTETVEIWYDAANVSGMPFSPRTNLGLQIGCGAADSIAALDDLLIWLDNRGFIVQSDVSPFIRNNNSGYKLQIISTEAITAEILSYTRRDDAIATTYNDRGHLMYQITFPTPRKTWVYDYTTTVWHERSFYNTYNDQYQEHLGQFYCSYRSLHIMAGLADGKIYLSKSNVYTDNSNPIHRIRSTAVINDEFRLRSIDSLEVRMETGSIDQDIDPQIILRYSNNGGHTWSNELFRDIGVVGEYAKSIRWNRLGSGREWVFETKIVSPIPFSIISGSLDIS